MLSCWLMEFELKKKKKEIQLTSSRNNKAKNRIYFLCNNKKYLKSLWLLLQIPEGKKNWLNLDHCL